MRLDARYQYLAGGVNTGHGWATWNPGGSFASIVCGRVRSERSIPVLDLLPAASVRAGGGRDEAAKDLSNLRNPATMRAYWSDISLLLRRVRGAGALVVIHVEPDLWGYLEQAHASALARGSRST